MITLCDTTLRDGTTTWTTVGASRNIIEGSWQALHDSFEYGSQQARAHNGRITGGEAA